MKKTVLLIGLLFLLCIGTARADDGEINTNPLQIFMEDLLSSIYLQTTDKTDQSQNNADDAENLVIVREEITPVVDVFEGVEPQKGVVGRWYPCGNEMSFMIVYQPIMSRSQSGQTADGMFLYFRVWIQNNSGRTINGLRYESFTLSKELNGTKITFPLSGLMSTVTSDMWEMKNLRTQILPGAQLDTWLVFDVDGAYNETWTLNFVPIERFSEFQFTPIRIVLPAISQQ